MSAGLWQSLILHYVNLCLLLLIATLKYIHFYVNYSYTQDLSQVIGSKS